MGRRVFFIAWVCTFACLINAEKDLAEVALNLFETLSTDIKKELTDHTNKLDQEFHENMIGERLHQVHDFRVLILPKTHQCYYQEAGNRTTISLNYECLNSPSLTSSGKVSVLVMVGPSGSDPIASDVDRKSGDLEFKSKEEGTYALCFANEHARNPISVQVEIDVWRHEGILEFYREQYEKDDPLYHSKLRIFQITRMIAMIRHAITHTRSMLYYDYQTVISNQSRVNNFSLVSFVIIASVCFIQLHVVKKMFGNQRTSV